MPEGSFLGELCRQHNIETPKPKTARDISVRTPPAQSAPRPKRQRAIALSAVLDLLLVEARPNRPFYVQVGANDGRLADPVFRSVGPDAFDGLLIEPSPASFRRLSETYRGAGNVRLLNEGVAEKEGTLTLLQLDEAHWTEFPSWAPGVASMDRDLLRKSFEGLHDDIDACLAFFTVPVRPLSDILASEGCSAFDLLVVDVEGMEHEVFASFDLATHRAKVIFLESVHMSDTQKSALFKRLAEARYRLFDSKNDTIAICFDWMPKSLPELLSALATPEIQTD